MLQIILSGKIVNRIFEKNPRNQEEIAIIEIEVSHWRQGEKVDVHYNCTFNPYWTERLKKLPASMKYLTIRASDITTQIELGKDDREVAVTWVRAEEYF